MSAARAGILAAARGAIACLGVAGCGGCGGDDGGARPPTTPSRRSRAACRTKVRAAQDPQAAEFPRRGGKTLQALADAIGGGPRDGPGRLRLPRRARTTASRSA